MDFPYCWSPNIFHKYQNLTGLLGVQVPFLGIFLCPCIWWCSDKHQECYPHTCFVITRNQHNRWATPTLSLMLDMWIFTFIFHPFPYYRIRMPLIWSPHSFLLEKNEGFERFDPLLICNLVKIPGPPSFPFVKLLQLIDDLRSQNCLKLLDSSLEKLLCHHIVCYSGDQIFIHLVIIFSLFIRPNFYLCPSYCQLPLPFLGCIFISPLSSSSF